MVNLEWPDKKEIDFNPRELRKLILEMARFGNTVHIGCSFSIVEILSVLFSKIMFYNSKNPEDESRDRFILSKGHGAMALYSCFFKLGWITQADRENYFSDKSNLHGLCEAHTKGIEATSGSLGHGLPIAVGMAYGLKLKSKKNRTFCIVGDGEINEGSIWEALLFASHHKLNNFYVIVDANQWQAMGRSSETLNLEPLGEKFKSFGFESVECEGHNPDQIEGAIKNLKDPKRPKAIIARTIKGKGVSFMEDNNQWHYLRLTSETYEKALKELSV